MTESKDNWGARVPEFLAYVTEMRPDDGKDNIIMSSYFADDPETMKSCEVGDGVPILEMMMTVTAHLMRTCSQNHPSGFEAALDQLREMAMDGREA